MAEITRGQGPDALPYGAAAQLNEATQDLNNPAIQSVPVMFAPGENDPIPDVDTDQNENMQVLLQGPNPAYKGSVVPKGRPGRVPRYVVRHLPELIAATKDPNCPPTLLALKNSIIRHLENEAKGG